MPQRPAIRVGLDKSMGSCGDPGTPVMKGSRDLSINSVPLSRVGDKYMPQPNHPSRVAMGGSRSVSANRLPLHRALDPISCGDKAANGSKNVGAG
jgi:uncharacterized Zn-binding protein involved in type VI secretion